MLIIDGYNLLHASGLLGRGRGPGFLERSRQALLNFLVESLDEKSLSRCTVVFDASEKTAPRGRPRITAHRGITVQYASGMPSADELIEELILKHSSPRKLTVVSSDHRLHRAAKRRKATPVDSDVWFRQVIRDRANRHRAADGGSAKPSEPASEFEVNWWLKKFGFAPPQSVPDPEPNPPTPAAPVTKPDSPKPEKPTTKLPAAPKMPPPKSARKRPPKKPPTVTDRNPYADAANPFPPGYGDDLLDEE
jgi:predicted RNA-binding protein with PIN domain